MSALRTTSEVVEALGGVPKTRDLVRAASLQRIQNWVKRGRFPPETYVPINEALSGRGLSADPALWRYVPVADLPQVGTLSGA